MRLMILLLVTVMFSALSHGELKTEQIMYEADGVPLKGYLAYDDSFQGRRPGILVVHEWYGHNDYARMRAEMLAKLGYVAFALDMYGNGKLADHPEDASKFSSEVMSDLPVMLARFNAARKVLSADPHVDTANMGAIGYCFGGGVVLNVARSGENLKGVVSFHGSLAASAPAEKGKVSAKILVCNGGDDKFVSAEAIAAFKDEMDKAGADYKFISYPGAIHSFTNPASTEFGKKFNLPLAYNEAADKASWKEMQEFFARVFGK